MKKLILLLAFSYSAAFGQTYPSPTYNNLTVLGTVSGVGFTNYFASPPAIGNTAPNTGTFTNLSSSGMVSGAGFTTLLSPYLTSATASATYAPLFSPALTGTPTAPTASLATNTTQIATTAFVLANSVTSSSPTITTPNIVGVTNASNAAAGSVGEYITSSVTGVNITTSGIAQNITSISLTAGDWDVWGNVAYVIGSGTTVSNLESGVNSVSATLPISPNRTMFNTGGTFATGPAIISHPPPLARFSLSTNTTIFVVGMAAFGVSTVSANALISARRVR